MMPDLGKRNVLGVMVDCVDYDAAADRIIEAATDRRAFAATALAVHGICEAQDPEHRARLNSFDLVAPDGQPVRWALRALHGVSLPDRVYGPELMLQVCQRAAALGLAVYLYGSTADVVGDLSERLRFRIPMLQIAGAEPSQFRRLDRDEKEQVVHRIRESGASVVFVGLGCPRQEVWTYEYRMALGVPVVAVGAAFDFHAGRLRQAPGFMQRAGLEWLFRLVQEPRRLWRRYLKLNPLYLWLLLMQRLRLRTFDDLPEDRVISEMSFG